jgi:hypothetical protein
VSSQNGDLKSEFNLLHGNGFSIFLDRKKKQFLLQQGSTNIPLYPIIHSMGVTDEDLEKTWGKEILAANKPRDPKKYVASLTSFFQKTNYSDVKTPTETAGSGGPRRRVLLQDPPAARHYIDHSRQAIRVCER